MSKVNKKKRYLILTPYFPSETSFMGNYILDQAKAIQENSKYNVTIVKLTSIFSTQKTYKYYGFNVRVFRLIDFPFFILPGIFHFINRIRFSLFLRKFGLHDDLAVVHAHVCYPASYLAVSLAKKMDVKTIAQHHGLDVLQLNNGRFRFLSRVQKSFLVNQSIKYLNEVSINVGVSSLVLSYLKEFKMYNPKKEIILYNGVNKDRFFSIPREEDNKFTIGCIGNFWPTKDQITLLKAIRILIQEKDVSDIYLKLIGTGTQLQECKDYVSHHQLNCVDFFEYQKHEELNHFYNTLDLFVLPSYYEAFGCVFLESSATKTPFITVEGQGIEELMTLEAKKHCLIKRRDAQELSNKILFFYNNRSFNYPFKAQLGIDKLIKIFLQKIESDD